LEIHGIKLTGHQGYESDRHGLDARSHGLDGRPCVGKIHGVEAIHCGHLYVENDVLQEHAHVRGQNQSAKRPMEEFEPTVIELV
jgi:hypothetical protein